MDMPPNFPLWPLRNMRRLLLQRIRSQRMAAAAHEFDYFRGAHSEALLQLTILDSDLRATSQAIFTQVVHGSSIDYREYLTICRRHAPAIAHVIV